MVTARLVLVSTYPPRECGLAAFARDLRAALLGVAPRWRIDVCAMDNERLTYGAEVAVVLDEADASGYDRAADQIAAAGADLVLIEHEYGIFGGPDGAHVGHLAAGLRRRGIPYAVTLHTVLPDPPPGKAAVLRDLCGGAALVTVFTGTARRMVVAAGLAPADRVALLPHGAPAALRHPVDPGALRPAVAETISGLAGGPLLSTFGLLRPDKGLELAIEALPAVVADHPDVRYLIAGSTHAHTLRTAGEEYREGLVALSRRLGVDRHVTYLNTYLTDVEVAALLAATDLYVTPYRRVEQISSGALTFAVVAGCATVSTAYRYAVDLLTPEDGPTAGVVVPCGDAAALGAAVSGLLGDPAALDRVRKAADALGARLTWPAVAAGLVETLSPLLPH
jgi:glycosyltransferase involved in cell wall biosynthesis